MFVHRKPCYSLADLKILSVISFRSPYRSFAFDEIGDFAMPPTETENGKITLTTEHSISEAFVGTTTFNLATMAIKPLYQKKH